MMCSECGADEGHEQMCTQWGMPAIEDTRALLPVGCHLVIAALKDGTGKYGPGHWRTVSVDEHLQHAQAHIDAYYRGDLPHENHLAHAVCRLVMAAALTKE
jgi:hypothetical protein